MQMILIPSQNNFSLIRWNLGYIHITLLPKILHNPPEAHANPNELYTIYMQIYDESKNRYGCW